MLLVMLLLVRVSIPLGGRVAGRIHRLDELTDGS